MLGMPGETPTPAQDWTQRALSPQALTPASIALLLAGRAGSPASQLGLGLMSSLAGYQMQEPERQARMAELKRQHEMQYGQTDIGPMVDDIREAQGMPRTNQPKMVSRWAAPSYLQALSALGRQQPEMLFDPEKGTIIGEHKPGQERTPVIRPAVPPTYGPPQEFGGVDVPSFETSGQVTAPGKPAVRAVPVRESNIPAYLQSAEREREFQAKPQNSLEAMAAFEAASEAVRSKSMDAETAWNAHRLGRYGWTFNQFAGYTPASPKAEPRLHYGPTGEIVKETPGEGPGYKQLRPPTPETPKEPTTFKERYIERVRKVDPAKAAEMEKQAWLVEVGRADLATAQNYVKTLDAMKLVAPPADRPQIEADIKQTMAIVRRLQQGVVEKNAPQMSDAAKGVIQRAQADKAAGKPWTREQLDRELEAAGVSRQQPGP